MEENPHIDLNCFFQSYQLGTNLQKKISKKYQINLKEPLDKQKHESDYGGIGTESF
jgi:hypothetical protein